MLGEPLGRVDRGYYADLVVLGGDPLTDITQAANVRQVFTGGRQFTVDDLLVPFATANSTIGASTMLSPVPDAPSNSAYWWHDPHYVAEARHSCCLG